MTFGRKIEFLSIPYYISGCRTWMYGRCNGDRMSTLHRTASIYKDVPGYLETLFSDNQSYTINFFIRAHAIINASNKLQANITYKSFAPKHYPYKPRFTYAPAPSTSALYGTPRKDAQPLPSTSFPCRSCYHLLPKQIFPHTQYIFRDSLIQHV